MGVKYEPDVFDGFEDIQFCFQVLPHLLWARPPACPLSPPPCGPWPVVPVLMSSRRTAWACHWLSHCVVWSPRKPWIGSSNWGGHTCLRSALTHTHTQSQSHTRDLKLFVPPHFPHPTRSPFRVLQTHTCAFACLSVSLFTHTHTSRC